jgi:CRP/FNR family transcriptional regulator
MASLEAASELQKKLRAIATTTVEPTGAVLFQRGDQVKGVFLILAGEVWMGLEERDSSYPSRLLGAGCAAGLPASLSGEPYSLTAKVAQNARIAFIPRTAILDLLRHNPKLSLEIMRVLSEEISEMRAVFDEKRLAVRS